MRNVGEWSEILVVLRTVVDRILPVVDASLTPLNDVNLAVDAVTIKTREGLLRIAVSNGRVESKTPDGVQVGICSIGDVEEACSAIVEGIVERSQEEATFEIEGASQVMTTLGIPTAVHNDGNSKVDVYFEQRDPVTNAKVVRGFSVKSFVGGKPTLLNSSGSTNIIYRVGLNLADELVEKINRSDFKTGKRNSISPLRSRLNWLIEQGATIAYADYSNPTFKMNLRMVDSLMPELWAFMVRTYYQSNESSLLDLALKATEVDVLNYQGANLDDLYRFRMSQFAAEISLGMRPSKPWKGNVEAPGGFIIVGSNFEIVSMRPENRMDYWSYLLSQLKLDTPSTTRHKFGEVYREAGDLFIKLNAQLRFI